MKQFLLFAGPQAAAAKGANGLVGDFASAAEAFLSLVDHQTPSEWWHILNTQTGEVIERRHIRMSHGMIGFQRSDWIVGSQAKNAAPSITGPTEADLDRLGADLPNAVVPGHETGNGHANGAAADH